MKRYALDEPRVTGATTCRNFFIVTSLRSHLFVVPSRCAQGGLSDEYNTMNGSMLFLYVDKPGDDGGGAAGESVGIVVDHVDVVAAVGREGLSLDGDHSRAGKHCNRKRYAFESCKL